MARIPDGELERLKGQVSLLRLIEVSGMQLIRQGKDWACRCPWHEGDDTPSCVITPATNLWHCFGCDAGGSVIDWVMRQHKVSFRHACELLAKEHPALAASGSPAAPAPKLSAGKLRTAQTFSAESDQALLDQVIEFYHQTLKASPEALNYLQSRGLGNMELIERFRLGYANRTLAYRLAPKQYKAGAESRSALQRVGILRDSGHEHLNGSIVVPLFQADESGDRHVVGAYGRKVLENLRAGTPKHLYLPGPHRGVLNREGIEGAKEVILCEALIDALTFWSAGYRNVTSCYGVHGLTDEVLAALKSCGTERVLIAFDRDEAGDRAAETVAKRLMAEGLQAFRLLFPKGEDANSYARMVKPPEKSLGVVIRSAQWLGNGAKPTLTTRCFNSVHQWVDGEEVLPSRPPVESVPATATATVEPEPIAPLAAEPVALDVSLPLVDAERPVEELCEPPAAAMPEGAAAEPLSEEGEQQLVVVYGGRRYRVRGWPKQLGEALKVNVLVSGSGAEGVSAEALHVDTLDLYQAKQRAAFAKCAAVELSAEESVIQHDLGRLLLKLEQLIDERSKAAQDPTPASAAMSETERTAALTLLRDPRLVDRIIEDVEKIGLVGEPANALVAYLACVSRKLAAPLAVLIQSTSAAGKSTLMEAILSLVPEEDRVQYSAMTGQSLFYLGEQDLKHKILAIAEEEGVRQAAYALKVLQSQGELTIASTGKDPATGMLVTQQYRVEGPVMLCLTTTAIDVDEELVNRCLVLTINESREQTRAIQQRQRAARTLSGLMASSEAGAIRELHRNAQRLLRPLAVVNPYAESLTFLDDRTRTRRDHAKYLTLIEAIALVRQHQRPVCTAAAGGKQVEYIEVTLDDIELANRLAHEVLGRSLDELPPQTRRVLSLIEALVAERAVSQALVRADVRFTRREVRERCGMSDAAVRVHLERLTGMEYIRPAIGRNGARFEYELLFDGDVQRSGPQMIGLIDVSTMRTSQGKMATSQGQTPDLAPRLHAACTHLAPTSQGGDVSAKAYESSPQRDIEPFDPQNALLRPAAAAGRDRSRTDRARGSLDPLAANGLGSGA
jgi:DNA primase catalytic core